LTEPICNLQSAICNLQFPMIPLVDTHCHLLAGLDDGPRTVDEALQMCAAALAEGVQMSTALAHQNHHYPETTPERIREAVGELAGRLRENRLDLTVFSCAEVMLRPDLEAAWRKGELLSVADRGQYLLVEMPHGHFVDLGPAAVRLRGAGVRLIVAHAERYRELLHRAGLVEEWIEAGCLVQLSSAGVTDPPGRLDARALKRWCQRGIVHLLGSDGHSPGHRPPRMAAAYHQIARWAGAATADRIGSTNGMAILQGLPLRISPPQPARWLARFWG
jgi:protein-tyrosine phosphatase